MKSISIIEIICKRFQIRDGGSLMTKKATNAMRIALALKSHGVDYLFGQSNPPSVTLACDDIGIKQIGYRQENAGSYMAQGYAMVTGKVPVVTAQNGPAATLLVAGLAESLKSSYPIVALVEEVDNAHLEKNAFQELDHLELFKGVSKWVQKIPSKDRIEDFVERAFTIAASGRPGPTVLLCPKDIINDPTEYEIPSSRLQSSGVFPLDRTQPDNALVKKAAELLSKAENPFIYAGGGVVSSGGHAVLREIQEEFSIPVATTTMGKGSVDEEHELTMGPIGYYMGKRGYSTALKETIQSADVILLVGNRTNQNGTDAWTLLPKDATYIQIDIDPIEAGRNYESLRLIGDAKTTLECLSQELTKLDNEKRKEKRQQVVSTIQSSRDKHQEIMEPIYSEENQTIFVEKFLYEVNKRLQNNHIVVADASISSVWNANYVQATEDRKFIFPRGLAGLGWGLPMAMGAKVGSPEQPVFALAGDGGFGHVWSELETCKRLGIKVVLAVINNSILGYQKFGETVLMGRYTNVCDFHDVDHVKVAEACGIKGIRLQNPSEIAKVLDEAFASDECVVIDLITEHDNIPPVTIMDKLLQTN